MCPCQGEKNEQRATLSCRRRDECERALSCKHDEGKYTGCVEVRERERVLLTNKGVLTFTDTDFILGKVLSQSLMSWV